MFEAEFLALQAISKTQSILCPQPLCVGKTASHAYLVLEFIPLNPASSNSQRLAGQQLAQLHQASAKAFGWDQANTIGSTHQPNHWHDSWIQFWQQQRLGFQLEEAARNGYTGKIQQLGEQLLQAVPSLLNHNPVPSLLHGDLWGGNIGYNPHGQPVIYDPASYYGDRETDLAMTELFGGFSSDFYAAYNEVWALDSGYSTRKTLYNLYHILNHLNLFGRGYLAQAESMVERLLAEV